MMLSIEDTADLRTVSVSTDLLATGSSEICAYGREDCPRWPLRSLSIQPMLH